MRKQKPIVAMRISFLRLRGVSAVVRVCGYYERCGPVEWVVAVAVLVERVELDVDGAACGCVAYFIAVNVTVAALQTLGAVIA